MADAPIIPNEAETRVLMRHAELVTASILPRKPIASIDRWTLKQVQGDGDWDG